MTQYVYINENREASYNPKDGYTAQCEVNLWNTVYSKEENKDRWRVDNGIFYVLTDEEYKVIADAKEKERIAGLHLTGSDVERGLYKALHKDFKIVLSEITAMQIEGLDLTALEIELKANDFYRGNPYINQIGLLLGLTEKQLDLFFETNNYMALTNDSQGSIT